ncbi:collagen-like triple helix repeat-containing protein [Myceligenerans halotolerans]
MARALAAVVVCGTAAGALTVAPAAAVESAAQAASAGPEGVAGPVGVAGLAGVPGPTAPAGAPLAASQASTRLPALIADGLAEASHSRYVYDGGSRTVKATVRTTIRNAKPDQGLMYFFWNSYGIPIPKGAENVRATSAGQSLSVRFEPTEDEFTIWATTSFSNLRYGQSRTIDWSYTIPGDPIRSKGYTRVGKGYATFATQAIGDPGSVSVEVVAPEGMEFTSRIAEFSEKKADGRRTWSTSSVTDEYGIWSPVSLHDPDQADTTKAEIGGEELTLLSFPGDKKWTKFVKKRLDDGLPVVEEMVGQEWPGGLKKIREDISTEVIGFAWYDTRAEEIVIGEDLDEQLFYHELTHTWVNGETMEGRWLIEGFTEAIARRVVEETGGKPERDKVARDSDGALALSTWQHLAEGFRGADDATESYAYSAAPATIEKLVADLDDEEFTALVSALLEGESAYEAPGAKHIGDKADWRRLLDLLEDRAGVEGAPKTLKTWVLTDKEKKELPKRAEEREKYFALDEADGEWQPPQGVRIRMTEWEFDLAAEARKEIGDEVPEAARRIQEAAAAAGFPAPSDAREDYEKASTGLHYADLAEMMPRAADVTEQVSDVVQQVDAERDPVTELAERMLLVDDAADSAVHDLDEGNLDEAAESADRTAQLVDLARWVGILMVVLALGAVALVVWLVIRARRRRRATPALAAPDASGLPEQAGQWLSDQAAQQGAESAPASAEPNPATDESARPLPSRSAAQLPPPVLLPPPTGPWDDSEPDDSGAGGTAPGDAAPGDAAPEGAAPDDSAPGGTESPDSGQVAEPDSPTPDDMAPDDTTSEGTDDRGR